jgi:hypothetical protein
MTIFICILSCKCIVVCDEIMIVGSKQQRLINDHPDFTGDCQLILDLCGILFKSIIIQIMISHKN